MAGRGGRPPMWNAVWDDRPEEYAQTRDCWLTTRRVRFIRELLGGAVAGDRVVELGSGTGNLLLELAAARPDLEFVGLEPQQSYVDFSSEAASRRGLRNAAFRTGMAERAAAVLSSGGAFRWLLTNDVLHHLSDVPATLRAAAELASPGARWLAIEPNWRNPYTFLAQAIKRGEKNFRPGPFLEIASAAGWSLANRSYLFLIPPFVKKPPRIAVRVERAFEGVPVLAGGVALTLARR